MDSCYNRIGSATISLPACQLFHNPSTDGPYRL